MLSIIFASIWQIAAMLVNTRSVSIFPSFLQRPSKISSQRLIAGFGGFNALLPNVEGTIKVLKEFGMSDLQIKQRMIASFDHFGSMSE